MTKPIATEPKMPSNRWIPARAHAVRIAVWYALVSALWILFSGWLLHYFVRDKAWAFLLEDVKGWFFVLVTAFLLGVALDRYFRSLQRSVQQIRNSEAKLHLVEDNLPGSYVYQYTRDPDGKARFTYVSAGVEQVHGVAAADVLRDANCLLAQLDPAQGAAFARAGNESARNLTNFEMELRARLPDGNVKTLLVRSRPSRDEAGRVQWDGFAQDITELKQAGEALQRSEQNYREIFNATNEAIFLHDAGTGRVLDVNDAMLRLYGYETKAEVLSDDFRNSLMNEPAYGSEEAQRRIRLANDEGPQVFEWLARRRNGQRFWTEVSLRTSQIGGQGRVLAVVRDISARKQAEQALQHSEENFRAMFEVASIGMAQADPLTGQWVRVNPKMCEIAGYSSAEMLRMKVPEITHPEDRARDWELFERVIRGEVPDYRLEKRYVRKDGSVAWVNVNMTVIRDLAGQPVHTMATVEDVTERKRLEAQFHQAQKMEAVGQLAGGVAHDFNNMLAAMMMQAELAAMSPNLPAGVEESLEQIRAAAERAASLTRQLLLFSRKQVLQPRDLDLNEVVTNLTRMLQRMIGEDVRLQLHLHPAPLITHADAGMLDQTLMNLAVNARDAMPNGGCLLIETAEKKLDAASAHLHPDAAPGRYACLSVTDTGCGIPAEVLPRIFEPFFTTKEVGKGTGLGLATVFGIIKQHRGWIKVESQPGKGTSFQVFLPASQAPAAAAPETANPNPRGGSETILLAEDDTSLRRITRKILEKYGYTVLEAANGVEALGVWAQQRAAVSLLLTDLVMPADLSGQQLARKLQQDKPNLKVIFTSGYSAEIAGRGIELHPGENFLQKPCRPNQLLHSIRRSLNS